MDEFEDAGQRYAFLLKPVKDLARNWDINICSELEKYVEALRQEIQSQNPNDPESQSQRKNFNFAEAAVLISGSTTVYGRKVDFVHQAALGFMTQLEETKKKKKGKGDGENDEVGEGGENSDGENEPHESTLDPFTLYPLDNLKYCDDLQLMLKHRQRPPPLLPVVPMAMMQLADFEKTNVPFYNKANKNEVVNKKDDFKINTCFILSEGVALLDLKNMDLIDKFSVMIADEKPVIKKEPESRPETAQANNNTGDPPDMTVNLTDGDVLKRPAPESDSSNPVHDERPSQIIADENAMKLIESTEDLFKLPESQSIDGKLPLNRPSYRLEVMRRETRSMYETFRPSQDVDILTDRQQSFDAMTQRRKSTGTAINAIAMNLETEKTGNTDSIIGGGADFDGDDFVDVENQENIPPELTRSLERTAQPVQNPPVPEQRPEAVAEEDDVWLSQLDELEAYDEVPYKNKPLKVNKKCWTYAQDQQEFEALGRAYVPSVKDFIHFNLYRRKLKKKAHVLAQFNAFLCDRGLLALNPIIYQEEKRRAKIKREREIETKRLAAAQRRSRSRTPRHQTPQTVDEDMDAGEIPDDEYGQIMEDLIRENDAEGGTSENKENENVEPDENVEAEPQFNDMLIDGDLDQSIVGGYLYIQDLEESVSKRRSRRSRKVLDPDELAADADVAAAFENDDGMMGITDLPPRAISQMSYEELVTYHLRKYWSIAEESRSKFCERVEKWEEKMIPLLEEEATRPDFSIHNYGTEILNKYGGDDGIGQTLSFQEVVKGVPRYEISRYFLSSLLLANTRNLEIKADTQDLDEDADIVINTMRVKLLGLERHHKMFENEQRLLTGMPVTSTLPPK